MVLEAKIGDYPLHVLNSTAWSKELHGVNLIENKEANRQTINNVNIWFFQKWSKDIKIILSEGTISTIVTHNKKNQKLSEKCNDEIYKCGIGIRRFLSRKIGEYLLNVKTVTLERNVSTWNASGVFVGLNLLYPQQITEHAISIYE